MIKNFLKIMAIILMALLSYNIEGKSIPVYELIIDFGNDFTFIHEVYKDKKYCQEKAKFIFESEKVKAYCIARKTN